MKKILISLCFIFAVSQIATAQIQWGVKGGINYNSDSFSDVKTDVLSGGKSNGGFHAGVWGRFKVPVIGLYIRPEIVYTQLNNEVQYNNALLQTIPGAGTIVTAEHNISKIDIPVLIGKKIFGFGNVFIGSFQYIIDSDFDVKNLDQKSLDGFSLGLQMGFGVEISKIGIDVRWERSLSNSEASFIDSSITSSNNFSLDNRVNQIIVGLSIRL